MKLTLSVLVACVLGVSGALAHSKEEKTTPARDATVQQVDAIEIQFDDPMRVTAIALAGPDGDVAIDRETGFDPVTKFRAVPPDQMRPGLYKVDWRGLSSDGHPMQGSFSFTLSE